LVVAEKLINAKMVFKLKIKEDSLTRGSLGTRMCISNLKKAGKHSQDDKLI